MPHVEVEQPAASAPAELGAESPDTLRRALCFDNALSSVSPETRSKTHEASPAELTTEAPAEPTTEAPAEPAAEASAQAPAEPVAEAPAEPVAEAPAEPAVVSVPKAHQSNAVEPPVHDSVLDYKAGLV